MFQLISIFFSETSARTWVPASVSCDKVDALSELSERSSSPSSRDRCSGVNDLMDDESVADEIEKMSSAAVDGASGVNCEKLA